MAEKAFELTANNYSTTLASGALAGDATISVVSVTGAPSTTLGNWRIIVDSEIMIVTSVSGTTLTVTRGAEGTTAAAHSSAAAVTHIVTKAALAQVILDQKPDNTLILTPDSTGGPSTTQFGWINQNSATLDVTGTGIVLNQPANAADSWTFLVKTIPATTYNVYARLDGTILGNLNGYAMILRQASDGQFIAMGYYQNSGLNVFVGHGTSAGPSITVVDASLGTPHVMPWFRIKDDGANRTYHFSWDGRNWSQFYTQAHATPFAPDQIGFGAESRSATYGMVTGLRSWQEA